MLPNAGSIDSRGSIDLGVGPDEDGVGNVDAAHIIAGDELDDGLIDVVIRDWWFDHSHNP